MERIFEKILQKKIGLLDWSVAFLAVLAVRSLFERVIIAKNPISVEEVMMEHFQNLFFFLSAILLIWLVLAALLKVKMADLSWAMILASSLLILPPVLDAIKTQGNVYWSFYLLSAITDIPKQFTSFFGYLPSGIVYFGTRIVFVLAVVFSSLLVYFRSKMIWKTLLAAVSTYSILFFLGSFPSWLSYFFYLFEGSKKISEIQPFQIMQLLATPKAIWGVDSMSLKHVFAFNLNFVFYLFLCALLAAFFFLFDRKKFVAVFLNARLPQLIYHSGLLFIGMGLGILAFPQNFNLNFFSFSAMASLLLAVWFSWIASVIFNDVYDLEIDRVSNPERPLLKKIFEKGEYLSLGVVFFFLALIGGMIVGIKFAILLVFYQMIAWFYSAEPFRLKKYLGLASFVSALASVLILFLGFILVSGEANLNGLLWRAVFLLIIAYTICIPVKDFKDEEGDRKEGIYTVPVVFGRRTGRLIVASAFFVSYVLSVFFLNEMRLFLWAVAFGGISFLIIESEKIKPRQLFWWVLGPAFVYGLILVKIVFL